MGADAVAECAARPDDGKRPQEETCCAISETNWDGNAAAIGASEFRLGQCGSWQSSEIWGSCVFDNAAGLIVNPNQPVNQPDTFCMDSTVVTPEPFQCLSTDICGCSVEVTNAGGGEFEGTYHQVAESHDGNDGKPVYVKSGVDGARDLYLYYWRPGHNRWMLGGKHTHGISAYKGGNHNTQWKTRVGPACPTDETTWQGWNGQKKTWESRSPSLAIVDDSNLVATLVDLGNEGTADDDGPMDLSDTGSTEITSDPNAVGVIGLADPANPSVPTRQEMRQARRNFNKAWFHSKADCSITHRTPTQHLLNGAAPCSCQMNRAYQGRINKFNDCKPFNQRSQECIACEKDQFLAHLGCSGGVDPDQNVIIQGDAFAMGIAAGDVTKLSEMGYKVHPTQAMRILNKAWWHAKRDCRKPTQSFDNKLEIVYDTADSTQTPKGIGAGDACNSQNGCPHGRTCRDANYISALQNLESTLFSVSKSR